MTYKTRKNAVTRRTEVTASHSEYHQSDSPTPRPRRDAISTLHRTLGNQAVQRLAETPSSRVLLSVSHPHDRDEREADRIATDIHETAAPMSRPERAEAASPTNGHEGAAARTARAFGLLQGPGQSLPETVRSSFGSSFDQELVTARIHTDATANDTADALGARAFTVGRDIGFAEGAYQPESRAGRALLAHELAHVRQADSKPPQVYRQAVEVSYELDYPSTAAAIVDERAERQSPFRFDPVEPETVAAARKAIEAGGYIRKAIAALNAEQLQEAEQRLAALAQETGLSEQSLEYIEKTRLRGVVDHSLGLLDSILDLAKLADQDARDELRAKLAGSPLMQAQGITELTAISVAVPAICLKLFGTLSAAIIGPSAGLGVLGGAWKFLSSAEVKVADKLLGAAGSVLALAHGAFSLATAKTEGEYAMGAAETGAGAGGLVGLATGSATMGSLIGAGAGLYIWMGVETLSEIAELPAIFVSNTLHNLFPSYRRQANVIAHYATRLDAALSSYYDFYTGNDDVSAQLSQELYNHVIFWGHRLAYNLYLLLKPRRGAVASTMQEYLLAEVGRTESVSTLSDVDLTELRVSRLSSTFSPEEAADGASRVPTASDVENLRAGGDFAAWELLETARLAIRALETVFEDPRVQDKIIARATRKVYTSR